MILLSELAILAILGGLAILPGFAPEGWLIAGPLLLLACIPAPAVQGRLRRDRAAFLVAVLFVAGWVPGQALSGTGGLWLILPGCVLAVLGLVRFRRLSWSRFRTNMTLAAVFALVACALFTAGARGVLALRSSLPIVPGRVDYLVVMLVLAGVWFGLDTHLRWLPACRGTPPWVPLHGGLDGMMDRVRPFLLLVALLVSVA